MQTDAWRHRVERALAAAVQVRTRQAHGFAGTAEVVHLGYLRLLSLEAGPLRLSRTPRIIARDPAHGVVVALQQVGEASLTQDGHSARLLPGDLAVIDLQRPFSLEYPQHFRQQIFRFPGGVSAGAVVRTGTVTGRRLARDEGVVALLAPLLKRLADRAAVISPDIGDLLAGDVAGLLNALLEEHAEDEDGPPGVARDHLLPAVRRYIDLHLGDPGLTPEAIAGAHRISVRYLHRLFEGEEATVSRLIQRRRIEECGRELARPGVPPAISAVAVRWGFHSPAHFSRAFRAVYGRSPREWRTAAALAGRAA
ncbi:AraC-like ligand-binding domain-containing protein [Streptomyces triculaminicus]|uniref:AraC-like ligand-binding domain-containing protein n=1 Tax=Streptomyces triculaminicus TaxID=2816232 RepID=UPI0037CFBA62